MRKYPYHQHFTINVILMNVECMELVTFLLHLEMKINLSFCEHCVFLG